MAFSQSISRAVKPWMSGNHSHFDAVRSMAGEKQRDVSPVPLRAHMQANPAFRKTTPPAALGNRIWWGRFRKVPKPEPFWGSSGSIRLRNYNSQRAQAQNVGHEGAIPAMPVHARSDLSDSHSSAVSSVVTIYAGAQTHAAGSKRFPELDGSLPQKLQEMQDHSVSMCIPCALADSNSSPEIGLKLIDHQDILGELMAGPYAGQDRGLVAIFIAATGCNISIWFNLLNDFPLCRITWHRGIVWKRLCTWLQHTSTLNFVDTPTSSTSQTHT